MLARLRLVWAALRGRSIAYRLIVDEYGIVHPARVRGCVIRENTVRR